MSDPTVEDPNSHTPGSEFYPLTPPVAPAPSGFDYSVPPTAPVGSETRLSISAEELQSPAVEQRVQQMRAATAPQLVRPVGPPPAPPRAVNIGGATGSMTLAGLLGGLAGFGIAEVLSQPDSLGSKWYGDDRKVGAMVFVVSFALGLGAVLAGWEGLQARSGKKFWASFSRALPLLMVGGAAGGWLAQTLYEDQLRNAIDRAVRNGTDLRDLVHVPRGIGFAVFCCAIGLALGAATRSSRRAVNGAIGGAVGGFIGGFVFDYIEISKTSGTPNRLVALTITGVVVGFAIGLVETARREHWLEIVSGGMAGKQFILYHDLTTVGSSPDGNITLIKDPGIAPQHFYLQRRGQELTLRSVAPTLPVSVNGVPIVEHRLSDGDLVQIGGTVIRYRAKAPVLPTAGAGMLPPTGFR